MPLIRHGLAEKRMSRRSAALIENDPIGLFATINAFAWLAYFVWIAALSIALILARDIPAKPRIGR